MLGQCDAASAYDGGNIIPQNGLPEKCQIDAETYVVVHITIIAGSVARLNPRPYRYIFFVSASGSNSFVIAGGHCA